MFFISKIKKEIRDLMMTLESLKEEVTALHHETTVAKNYINVKGGLEWFEDHRYIQFEKEKMCDAGDYESARELSNYARYLERKKHRQFIESHPALKKAPEKYHGSCLLCKTVENESLRSCLNCAIFHWDFKKYPNLSKKYRSNENI